MALQRGKHLLELALRVPNKSFGTYRREEKISLKVEGRSGVITPSKMAMKMKKNQTSNKLMALRNCIRQHLYLIYLSYSQNNLLFMKSRISTNTASARMVPMTLKTLLPSPSSKMGKTLSL